MQSPCAHHVPHYTAQALRARGKRAVVLPHAFGLPAIVAGWTSSATSTASAAAANTATTAMHSPTHRRLRQPLRRQRCTARARFTRPAWPRRALRSHHQRDSGETRFFNTTRADYKKSLGGIFGAATPLGALVYHTKGGLVPSKISGVGTNIGLLVHVLPGPNKQRAFKPSTLLS